MAKPNVVARRDSPRACLITVAADGTVRRWNREAEAMFGHPTQLAEAATVEQLLPFLSGHDSDAEGWCRRMDGTVFRGLVASLSASDDASNEMGPCQVLVVTDITSRYMREAEHRRTLESQVLDATEQLQRQIGQDLHDGLGQLLTGTAFLAKGLQVGLAAEFQPQAQRIVELINLAIAQVRNLARGLSPIQVDEQRLEVALRNTVSEASELLGVACELVVDDFVDQAQPATVVQLSLIAREAITNAVRHGKARNIVVRLSRAGERSALSVEDDGVGIDEVGKPLEGLGMHSMRQRAKVVEGDLEIVRTPSGTLVRCQWRDS